MAERQSRGRKQPRIDGGVNLQVEASIGSRAERRSGSGAAVEDGGAGADLQRQSAEGATGGADRARASIRRRADGRSRGGRPEQRRTGGRRAGCRRRAAEFQVLLPPPSSLPLSLYSLSLPISRFCVLLGWGAPTLEVYALDFPLRASRHPFSLRAQPILRPCSVRLDESDAKATTRAREATP